VLFDIAFYPGAYRVILCHPPDINVSPKVFKCDPNMALDEVCLYKQQKPLGMAFSAVYSIEEPVNDVQDRPVPVLDDGHHIVLVHPGRDGWAGGFRT